MMTCCQWAIVRFCHLCAHSQTETVVVGSQLGLPCGSIGTVTTGQELVVDGFLDSPHSKQIPNLGGKGPSAYKAILLENRQQSMLLTRCGLLRSSRGLAWHQSFSGSIPPEDAVDSSTSQTHATSNSILPHALMGKCKHFMPNTYSGRTGYY